MDAIKSVDDGVKHDRFNPRARDGRDSVSNCSMDDISRFNPRARDGRDFWCLKSFCLS